MIALKIIPNLHRIMNLRDIRNFNNDDIMRQEAPRRINSRNSKWIFQFVENLRNKLRGRIFSQSEYF